MDSNIFSGIVGRLIWCTIFSWTAFSETSLKLVLTLERHGDLIIRYLFQIGLHSFGIIMSIEMAFLIVFYDIFEVIHIALDFVVIAYWSLAELSDFVHSFYSHVSIQDFLQPMGFVFWFIQLLVLTSLDFNSCALHPDLAVHLLSNPFYLLQSIDILDLWSSLFGQIILTNLH